MGYRRSGNRGSGGSIKAIAFTLLVFCMSSFATVLADGLTWYVAIDGNDETGNGSISKPFQTIQRGIESASQFDTVQVAAGTYMENVVLKESVYLRGSGYESSTISAHANVVLGADGSTIEGFMITNDGNGTSWGYGPSVSSTTIRNNVFKDHYIGIHCGQTGSSELIINNVIIDNGGGIYFGWDAEPTIRNNIVVNNNIHWYNNTGQNYKPNADIAYNNLWNGKYDFSPSPATGNIAADPLFANGILNDFRLTTQSPCIDSGDPDATYNDVDGTRNDMGVYGGPAGRTYDYALPVELVSFEAKQQGNKIVLRWFTATETNNFGFEIERKKGAGQFIKTGFVRGSGSTTEPQRYTFTDSPSKPGSYFYRLKQVDTDGTYAYSNIVTANIGLPAVFTLHQNYPNPFNPSTTIAFELPESGVAQLSVYNVQGTLIAMLLDEYREAGNHQVIWHPEERISDGVYYYRLRHGNSILVRKAIVMK